LSFGSNPATCLRFDGNAQQQRFVSGSAHQRHVPQQQLGDLDQSLGNGSAPSVSVSVSNRQRPHSLQQQFLDLRLQLQRRVSRPQQQLLNLGSNVSDRTACIMQQQQV
jgi:hypothetical protein